MKPLRIFLIIAGLIFSIFIFFQLKGVMYTVENQGIVSPKVMEQHKTVSFEGYDIHYYVSGKENSTCILFLHPAFSDHRAFDFQIPYFSEKYKVITMDMLGHGCSQPGESSDKFDKTSMHIKKILEKEDVSDVHLVGVSVGSLMAQYFALEYPEGVLSLTSVGGYNINLSDKKIKAAQRNSNLAMIFRALFSMKAFKGKVAELSTVTEEGRALFFESSKNFSRKSFLVMQGLEQVIKERELKKPGYPILLITGENELDLAKEAAQKWQSVNPQCQWEEVKKAGHCANMDQPEEFNDIISRFLEKIAP